MSRIRRHIRNLEYSLPIAVQRPLIRAVRETPYAPEYEKTRSIFVHIPKTAGTSIGTAIYGHWVGHVPLSRFAAFDSRKFASYFKFSFVRNPWDRLLSAFAHLKGFGLPIAAREAQWVKQHLDEIETFEEFVLKLCHESFRAVIINDVHFRPQLDWITFPGSMEISVDYVGRFESVGIDYPEVMRRLGLSAELPLLNTTKRPPYREAYSKQMAQIVGEVFRNDIERLGYSY